NAQIITTVAGDSIGGYNGDGALATTKYLNNPAGVATDQYRNIYIADAANNRVRKVTVSTGVISTIAGNGVFGFGGDGMAATNAKLSAPYSVAVDAASNVYIADRSNNRIRKVNASGIITTVAGTASAGYTGDNGAASAAQLSAPTSITLDAAGNLYIADYNNNAIRKITASTGNITTVAGNGTQGYSGDNGQASSATLYHPTGVTIDAGGNMYIADNGNNVVRKVNTSGVITTVAGNNTQGFGGDNGAATSAQLNLPWGVAVIGTNLYISDYGNFRIRKVNTTGNISTIAGNGTNSYTGDCGISTAAKLSYALGLTSDVYGNLYISDYSNNGVRKISFNATKATVAGLSNPVKPCSGAGFILKGSGANTYVWSGGIIDGVSSPAPVNTTTAAVASNYTVTGTDTLQCSATAVITVSVNINPTIYVPNGNITICAGQAVTLTALSINTATNAGTVPYLAATFSWTSGVVNGVSFIPAVSSGYIVTGTDVGTGCSSTATASVTVVPSTGPLPVISSSSSNAISACGSSAILTASGGNTYTWSPGSHVGTNYSVSPNMSTTYTVTGTLNGCIATSTVTQVVNIITVASSKDTICSGSSVTLTASGATSYTWTTAPSLTTSINPVVATPTVSTTYTITGISPGTGTTTCQSTTLVPLRVRTIAVSTNKDSLCNGSAAVLMASGANTYSWSTSQSGSSISITPTITTTYSVTGVAQTCTVSGTIKQFVKSPIMLTITSSQDSICVGDSAKLTASGANSYIWSTTQTGSSIYVQPTVTTSYLLSGTVAGCSTTTNFSQKVGNCFTGIKHVTGAASQITLYPNPVVNGAFTISLSENTANTTIYVINAIGQTVYETKGTGLETQISLPNYQPGVYFVQIKNTNGTSVKKVIVN
ncbi:MAG: T9SS type A sorting domain-containing protein, partial [Bacteroidia bacterium]